MFDDEKAQVQHDLNNALSVLLNSFQVTTPSIRECLAYIKNNQAYDLLSQDQVDLLERSLEELDAEINKLYKELYE